MMDVLDGPRAEVTKFAFEPVDTLLPERFRAEGIAMPAALTTVEYGICFTASVPIESHNRLISYSTSNLNTKMNHY
jgi:hypothetical protein